MQHSFKLLFAALLNSMLLPAPEVKGTSLSPNWPEIMGTCFLATNRVILRACQNFVYVHVDLFTKICGSKGCTSWSGLDLRCSPMSLKVESNQVLQSNCMEGTRSATIK